MTSGHFNKLLERVGSPHRVTFCDEMSDGLTALVEALVARIEALEKSLANQTQRNT